MEGNKRIATNTLMLSVRMAVMLFVNLYASRVVLDQLGESNLGLYNVVGSLVLMFAFIQGSIASSASRFYSFEIGSGTELSLNKVFCMSMNVHLIFALIVFLFSETVGLWYMFYKMSIPDGRFTAAMIVYQISNVNAIMTILLVPFSAMIISYEKMSAFAYISIFEAVAKLFAALFLAYTTSDKLVVYALSLFAIQFVIQFLYMTYCKRKFKVVNYHLIWDKVIFREMFSFVGWSLLSYSKTVSMQCINLMINAFFGTTINAARAVASQVQNNVYSFVNSFQVAINPQIVKNYAAKDMNRVYDLADLSTKISFSLMLFLMFPLLVNLDFVLNIWLVEVPKYTKEFIILIATSSILSLQTNPLNVIAESANRLKYYNIVNSIYTLLQIIVSYVILRLLQDVYVVFWIQIVSDFILFFIRLKMANNISGISIARETALFLRTSFTILVAAGIGALLINSFADDFAGFLIKCLLATAFTLSWSLLFVLSKKDREPVFSFVKNKVAKFLPISKNQQL